MKRKAIATTLVLSLALTAVVTGPRVAAAQQSQERGGLGGVIDALSGILGGGQRLHGHVVLNKSTSLVIRADDGRTYAVDTSQVDPRLRTIPQTGEGVTVLLSQPRQGGGQRSDPAPKDGGPGATPSAQQIQLDAQAGGQSARKTFQTVQGTVEEMQSSQVLFRSRDGLVLPVDVASIRGLPPLTPKEPATLYYEQGPRHEVVGVWVEPGVASGTPTAGPQPPGSPPSGPQPSASIPEPRGTDLQRVHGLVESVSVSGFTLSADDGRKVSVETTQVPPDARRDVRPGDLVTVFGRRVTDRTDALIADFVEPDQSSRR